MPVSVGSFDSGKESLSQLLEEVHCGGLQLPDFQRGWVWDDDHIKSLLASVSLAYPIGAVLTMETGGDAHFKPRLVEGVEVVNPPTPARLILDGQQRLTSLYLALRSRKAVATRDGKRHPIKRWYYVNILKAINPQVEREDAFESIPEGRIRYGFRGQIELDLSSVDKECEAHMLPLSAVFDTEALFRWQMTYLQIHGSTPEILNVWNSLFNEVVLRFQQYHVPVIGLKRETPKEAICQVFEKVNTGGVTLTVFELVTASFAADSFALRDDWDARRSKIHGRRVLRGVSGSDFLTAATLLATWKRSLQEQDRVVSCKRRDILQLSLDDYKASADQITIGFEAAAQFLAAEFVFDETGVPYQTQLIPLAAICAALGADLHNDTAHRKLARWYWCGVFGELYGASVETRFAKDLQQVVTWIRGTEVSEPDIIRDCNFVSQRLFGLRTRNSAAYKGLCALLMREGTNDFCTGNPVQLTTYFDEAIDIHHIFPRSYCTKLGIDDARMNCIVNKTMLSSRSNRIISGYAPAVYLESVQRRFEIKPERLDEILRSHLIEPSLLRRNEFDAFFESRLTRLLDLIERVTGKTIGREQVAIEAEAATAGEDEDGPADPVDPLQVEQR